MCFDEVDDDAACLGSSCQWVGSPFPPRIPRWDPYLSRVRLADEAGGLLLCDAIVEAEALDVGVSRGAIVAVRALDLADLHHLCAGSLRVGDRYRYRRVGEYFGGDRCGRGDGDGGNAGIQELMQSFESFKFPRDAIGMVRALTVVSSPW